MKSLKTSNFDIPLFLSFMLLTILGLVGIYSTTFNVMELSHNLFIKQFIWIVVGIILFFLLLFVDYGVYNRYAEFMYLASVILLIFTLIAGNTMRNTKGWLSFLGVHAQFSELTKITVVFMLSKYLSSNAGRLTTFRDYLIPLAIALFPTALILLQPDLGTALVMFPILLSILYMSGMDNRHTLVLLVVVLIALILPLWMSYYQIVMPDSNFWLYRLFLNRNILLFIFLACAFVIIVLTLLWFFTNKPVFRNINITILVTTLSFLASVIVFYFLKTYHKKRLLVFINPDIDRLDSGYNIIQSMISIGSGQIFGKGFLKGTQSLYGFLPAQSTDFVYSLLAEQFGFILSLILLTLFLIIIIRGINIIRTSKDMFGSLTATGIISFLFFHLFVNIGMAVGILPVIGLPLPFMSYGGSSLLTFMFSMAVLMNIRMNRYVNV